MGKGKGWWVVVVLVLEVDVMAAGLPERRVRGV